MKMHYKLELKQQQKLVMTPALRQSIEILQLSAKELEELIKAEILENPVLEYKNPHESYSSTSASAGDQGSFEDRISHLAARQTLREYLKEQLPYKKVKANIFTLAEAIIDSIDSSGYLNTSGEELSLLYHAPLTDVELAIQTIQSLSPVGVGARNLKECLLLQAAQISTPNKKIVIAILQEYLEEVATNKLKKIANALKINCEQVEKAVATIKNMNPKPGASYGDAESTMYIIPDAKIVQEKGNLQVQIKEHTAPTLMINRYYLDILKNSQDEETKTFILNKIRSAQHLIDGINHRKNTIAKILELVTNIQEDFFLSTEKKLLPLTQKEIAETLEIHESTVSRAIHEKYIECDKGVYEIAFFFQSGIFNANGELISAHNVKKEIAQIIANENKNKPLSDEKIRSMLKEKGMNIARRTVTKYRMQAGFPSTSIRRIHRKF